MPPTRTRDYKAEYWRRKTKRAEDAVLMSAHRESSRVRSRKYRREKANRDQQTATQLAAQHHDPRFQEIMHRWPTTGSSQSDNLGPDVLKKVFSLPSKALTGSVNIGAPLFGCPEQYNEALRTQLVCSIWVDIFDSKENLRIWNTHTNQMDRAVDLATLHAAYVSRNHLKDVDNVSQGPFTVLGVKSTKKGLLQHHPVLPVLWTMENGITKELTTVARGSGRLMLESVLSEDGAITDFHVDVTIWGSYCFEVQGGKVVISAPPTTHNWSLFKSNYCREEGNDRCFYDVSTLTPGG
jgi:hypothetical protein